MKQAFLSARNITIRVYDMFFFGNTFWQMHDGEQWLILGPNGSGKSVFAKAIAGLLPLKHGEIICHFVKDAKYPYPSTNKDKIAYLSFEIQQKTLMRDSLQRDLESFMGVYRRGKTVRDYLELDIDDIAISNTFSIDSLSDRLLETLSTGEMRKVFLIKTLLQKPKLLILDEPFDGLDAASKVVLMNIINDIMKKIHVILIVHNPTEIPAGITHVMVMKDCRIAVAGKRDMVMRKISNQVTAGGAWQVARRKVNQELRAMCYMQKKVRGDIIISMHNVTVHYGNKKILDNINWTVRKGENWVILGHNGAGKSTLMHLITGDQLQSYSNEIKLFGQPKESIPMWEIKKHIGIVSTDVMLRYDKQINAYDVILSGFFDSIGLYRRASEEQKQQANEWIDRLHIQELAEKEYHHLSFGQKRLILITRAVVKSPRLLIVDEPCHGLDHENKKRALDMLDQIGNSQTTNILLITHNKDEIISSITNVLELENGRIVRNEHV